CGASNSSGSIAVTSQTSHFAVKSGDREELRLSNAGPSAGSCRTSASSLAFSGILRKSTKPGQHISMRGASPPSSTSQSASTALAGHVKQVAYHCGFGPMDLIAAIAAKKGTVAAVTCLNKRDVRVRQNRDPRLRQEPDKWIVEGMQNQCRDRDSIDDACTCGTEVVIIGIAKATIASDDFVIELANGSYRTKSAGIVKVGIESGLSPIAPLKSTQEMPFVAAIHGLMQSVGTGSQVDRRADCRNRAEWSATTPFPSQLEDQIATH